MILRREAASSLFVYSTSLKLRDTDAAGVAFFAAYFSIAHDAYESFLKSRELSLVTWLDEVHLPIVHTEANYSAPLRLGDEFDVVLWCDRLGSRSFTLCYEMKTAERLLATLKTVHVAVAPSEAGSKAVSLPDTIRQPLEAILLKSSSPSEGC